MDRFQRAEYHFILSQEEIEFWIKEIVSGGLSGKEAMHLLGGSDIIQQEKV